ncbi:M14 family metallopeptidase [bacterium]|nr:M14 family metallopeptidase [bacterium]
MTFSKSLITVLFALTVSFCSAFAGNFETYYEQSGNLATPRYAETLQYCQDLAKSSDFLHYTNFGTSPRGREMMLLVADKNGNFSAEQVRSTDNAVLLVQAGIHAGEIDGKDAGLMLLRDIAHGKLDNLLDHVTIIFMPIFNVDGHERFGKYNRPNQNGPEEMGWRVTSKNLNLNRDYLKADTLEMQHWIRLYNEWLPEFFIDCHVSDGADFQYVLMYGLETRGNMPEALTNWIENNYKIPLNNALTDFGMPMIEYGSFIRHHDPKSGLAGWVAPPKLSQGYTALRNRPGLLLETHMFKSYEQRVTGTYEVIKETCNILNRDYLELRAMIKEADSQTCGLAYNNQSLPLTFKSDMTDSTMIDFLGFEYTTITSDLTGGSWPQFSDKPATFSIPYFSSYSPDKSIDLPRAYLIPPEWNEVISILELHGATVLRLSVPATVPVSSYKFTDAKWGNTPYEGRFRVSCNAENISEVRTWPAGTALIRMNQDQAKVIAHFLEPDGLDSAVRWGYFGPIFEQKEYIEGYVMEQRAREMLAANPDLKTEFESAKKDDSELANNPRAILRWFYQRSPWWDDRINVYPVGRIFDNTDLHQLLKLAE